MPLKEQESTPMIPISRNQGFTLLEVMIALVIFSIGLLGLAGLQGISVRNNQVAFSRTVASQLAYDLADRIRNNKTGDYTQTIPTSSPGSCITSSNTCKPSDLAKFDLYEWDQTLNDPNNNLSGVQASITATGTGYTVAIGWDEKNQGLTGTYDCLATPPTPTGVECVKVEVLP